MGNHGATLNTNWGLVSIGECQIEGDEAQAEIQGAKKLFDDYLKLTHKNNPFERCIAQTFGSFLYSEETLQTDMMVFRTIFTLLQETIGEKRSEVANPNTLFKECYTAKRRAFSSLEELEKSDGVHTQYNGLFELDQNNAGHLARVPLGTPEGMSKLCGTMRNGLSHFNYRYTDAAPNDYLKRLGFSLPLPVEIAEAGRPHNYRIFLCDKLPGTQFMDPKSGTRLRGVGFAHLRYWLFIFLARFFYKVGDVRYDDILFPAGMEVSGLDTSGTL